MTTPLGVYTSGEVPAPLAYTFQDSVGATITEIDSPDWTVTFRRQERGGDAIEDEATAADGVATYVWVDGDMTAGSWRGEFHATNNVNTFISEPVSWYVRAAIPAPTP